MTLTTEEKQLIERRRSVHQRLEYTPSSSGTRAESSRVTGARYTDPETDFEIVCVKHQGGPRRWLIFVKGSHVTLKATKLQNSYMARWELADYIVEWWQEQQRQKREQHQRGELRLTL